MVWMTIAGAILGYPLFLWMDPLALLSNAFSVFAPRHVLGCSVPVRHIYPCINRCNLRGALVCPGRALQPLNLEQKNKYIIGTAQLHKAICIFGISDCNACVNACAFDAIKVMLDKEAYETYPVVDLKKCNGCGACEERCPTKGVKAIKVLKKTG